MRVVVIDLQQRGDVTDGLALAAHTPAGLTHAIHGQPAARVEQRRRSCHRLMISSPGLPAR